MKKSLSILLCLVMLLSAIMIVPFSASAEDVDVSDTGAEATIAGEGADESITQTGYILLSESQFINKINELKSMYPAKTTPDYTYYEGGYARAWTCHGFANMLAYYCFGSSIYTSGGGWSESWDSSSFNAGDIVRVDGDSHTIFITYVSGNIIKYGEGNVSHLYGEYSNAVLWDQQTTLSALQSRFTKKWHLSGNNLTGTGSAAPSYAYISTDKQNYAVDEIVHFSFNTDITDKRNTLWVYCPDGSTLYYQNQGTCMDLAFGMQGHFEGLVESWNDFGSCKSQRISWHVGEPQYAYVTIDKQNYAVDENVHFVFDTDILDKSNTLWVYCPDGSTLYYQNLGWDITLAFGMSGHFEGLVQAWNDYGNCISERISWHVGAPQYAYVNTDKQNYSVDENVHFTFDTDINDNKNTLWVYCPDGSTLYYQHLSTNFTLAFGMQGHFEGLVQAWNDYGNCISERISWNVGVTQILGDADGDGEVTAVDVSRLMLDIARLDAGIDHDTLMNGDVDGNGVLEVTDVTFIQRYLAKLETSYAIGEQKQ